LLNKFFIEKLNNKLIIPYFNNTWLCVNSHEYIDKIILIKGTYEQEVFEKLMSFAKKDEVLWDIGAHIGSFSLKALNQKNISEVYCFEPNPKTFGQLKYNKELNNNPEKLKIWQLGLGDKNGVVPFEPNKEGNSGRSRFLDADPDVLSLKLVVTTIDDLIFKQGLTPPTLIKIDVEGFEKCVFMGAERLFNEHPPKAIIFENAQENSIISDEFITAFFKKYKYTLELVYVADEVGSLFQNFIAFK